MTAQLVGQWVFVCELDRLWRDRGCAALIDGEQVAIFRLSDSRVFAVGHRDPFTGANVMARGLVGSRGDTPTVASPLHKQVFDLTSGVCLDDPTATLGSWQTKVEGTSVFVRRGAAAT